MPLRKQSSSKNYELLKEDCKKSELTSIFQNTHCVSISENEFKLIFFSRDSFNRKSGSPNSTVLQLNFNYYLKCII